MGRTQEKTENTSIKQVGNINRIWTDIDDKGQIRLFASARHAHPEYDTFVQLDTVLGITVEFEIICATEEEVILKAKACVSSNDRPSALPVLAQRYRHPSMKGQQHD